VAILLGTSGFSYEDWRGTWYPPGTTKPRMLEAYAAVFDALEINATYYRTPPMATARSMVERAAGRLRFAVKAPGDVTHRRRLDRDVVVLPWRHFLEPFAEAGVLAATLLQFPAALHDTPEARGFMILCRRALSSLPCVVELRHASWDEPAGREFLAELGWPRAVVDQPELRGLSASGASDDPPAGIAYFRFHGRNAASWHASDSADPSARYRYRYAHDELAALAAPVARAAERAQTTLVFFNNHPDGNAPLNAEEFAPLVGVTLRSTGYRDLFS
jgi:uncharacterized protein YecE (DUF72 family)